MGTLMDALACATACDDIYRSAVGLTIYDNDGVYVGYSSVGDIDLFTFRGSVTVRDWIDDLDAVPINHTQLGTCHAGMLRGMDDAFTWAKATTRKTSKAAFIGHSLGGAHARLMAGLFAKAGLPIAFLTTFGSPKPAYEQLREIINTSGIEHSSYRHLDDVVPTLPPDVLEFVHTENWTELSGANGGGIQAVTDHSCNLYVAALS